MGKYLGIDCGATNLRIGVFDEQGNLLNKWKIPSPLKSQPEKLADIVKEQIGDIQVQSIGIGVPGPLDLENGSILQSPNLGNQQPIKITSQFDSVFSEQSSRALRHIKIYLDRDTNVALLGEAWKGGAVGLKDVVMLTLGSGVGGAIMINGEIEHGESGKAGELGHMIIGGNGICGLGHKGCLEGMINSTQDLDEMGTYLGLGLANIVDIFNPEKIIIGGGKINYGLPAGRQGDFLTKAVEIMKEKGMKPAVDEVLVEYAKLKDDSGLFGAAKLVIGESL